SGESALQPHALRAVRARQVARKSADAAGRDVFRGAVRVADEDAVLLDADARAVARHAAGRTVADLDGRPDVRRGGYVEAVEQEARARQRIAPVQVHAGVPELPSASG